MIINKENLLLAYQEINNRYNEDPSLSLSMMCDEFCIRRSPFFRWRIDPSGEKTRKTNKEWRNNNKEFARQIANNYTKNNKDKIAKYHKKYTKENSEYISNKKSEYYNNNKEYILKRSSDFYKDNKERIGKRNSDRYNENKDRINETARQYRANNPLLVNARNKINSSELRDIYVKRSITRGTRLKHSDIPNSVVELERARIKLNRQLNQN